MRLPVRLLCCLLSLSLCSASFAQSVPLAQVQAKARKQVNENTWIKRYLLPAAATAAAAGGWLAINNARVKRQNRRLRQQTQELEKALNDYRYEVGSLREQRSRLIWERDRALEQWNFAENRLKELQPKKLLPARSAVPATADTYMFLSHSNLSKEVIAQSPYQLSQLTDWQRRSVVAEIDRAAAKSPSQALLYLDRMAREANHITVKQLYIKAGRCLKVIAVAGIFAAFLAPQDAHAARQLGRLEENPSLFLNASPEQLKIWEQNPQADAVCRRVAEAINQAATLQLTDAQARTFLRQAAEEQASRRISGRKTNTEKLAR